MTGQLIDGIAGLEVGEAEAGQDVRTADHEDAEVDEVEEEREAGRERRDHHDRAEHEELDSAQHQSSSPLLTVDQASAADIRAATSRGPPWVPPDPSGVTPSIGVESRSSATTWPGRMSWIVELVLMIRR